MGFGQISGRSDRNILNPFLDSIKIQKDTTIKDSLDILISPDAPEADVVYSSKDSSYLDAQEKMFYLFGDAVVKYQSYELKAAKIRLDMNSNIAYAEGVLDTNGKLIGLPHFSDGTQEFDAVKMRYNFRTRKGIIDEAVTKYTDLFIRGTKTKFIGGDPKDTTQHDIIYNRNAIITSCNAEQPHFGIRSTKQKFVKDKMVIIGPSNLEIMGVPTPLWLPFGFFPVSETRSAGLIIPRDYEYSQTLGFGLRNVGYYLPLGEHMDLSLQGDIYTRGSWGIQISSNYNKRYKFSGNFLFAYSNRRFEVVGSDILNINKSYSIQWRHAQASQANPYNNFSASVNIQTNGYQKTNFNDAGNVLNNSLSSNINYSKTFPGKPYSLSASVSHSQNTRDKTVILSLPNLNFQMQRIYPFKRKIKVGDEKWYEQISFNYNAGVQSLIRTSDSTFFSANTFNTFSRTLGMRQVASSDLNLRILKYFNLSPSINFKEIWNMQSVRIGDEDREGNRKVDTLAGFKAAHIFDASLNLNTILYGTAKFNHGPIRGFRHTIRPNIGLNYSPASDPYEGIYNSRVISGKDTVYTKRFYSKFQGMTYDEVPLQGTRLGIGYGLTHVFEGKYFSKKDSLDKKFKLFDNVYMNGFYNFVADSFKWSPLTMGGTTRFLGGLSTLSINAGFSFYQKNSQGILINKTLASAGKAPFRLDNLAINLGTNFNFSDLKDLISKWKGEKKAEPVVENPETDEEGRPKPKKRENPETFWQMFKGFYFNHNLSYGPITDFNTRAVHYGIVTHTLSTQGAIELSKNWSVTIGNIGYDFRNKGLTYPDLGFSRVLHCWRMTFSYQPIRGTYAFNIFANQGTFNFLKLPYRKNFFDPKDDL
ncbi:MAG: putative LPS assembly protein LptD [Saprospiraceae bacterium]